MYPVSLAEIRTTYEACLELQRGDVGKSCHYISYASYFIIFSEFLLFTQSHKGQYLKADHSLKAFLQILQENGLCQA